MRRAAVARKITPRVKDGRVQRKNHRDVARRGTGPLALRVEVPGPGYRHVLSEEDIRKFIAILPDWEELSVGLEEIVLAAADDTADGWYEAGSVYVCAWPDEPEIQLMALYYEAHREVLAQLRIQVGRPGWSYSGLFEELPDGIELERQPDGRQVGFERDERGRRIATCEAVHDKQGIHLYDRVHPCRFPASRARAFQLLHILLHELGHHRDSQRAPAKGLLVRGEEYAEAYALRHGRLIFDRYLEAFGL